MAKRRSNIAPASGRLADRRPASWLEQTDYDAVRAAGIDPDLLAAIIVPDSRRDGSLQLRLSAGRHSGPDAMREYVLGILAHDRRQGASKAWADENGLDRQLAITYFYDAGAEA